jgi:hypothetical protein
MIQIVLPSDGVYEIEVRSYADESGGAYTLVIGLNRPAAPTLTSAPTATLTPAP